MQRKYFVSFARSPNHGAGLGFSHAVMTVPGPMTDETFGKVFDYLAETNPDHSISILSFQELETAETTASV